MLRWSTFGHRKVNHMKQNATQKGQTGLTAEELFFYTPTGEVVDCTHKSEEALAPQEPFFDYACVNVKKTAAVENEVDSESEKFF